MKLNTDILGDCRLVVMEVRGRLEQSSSKAVTWRSPGRSSLTQRRWPPHPAFGQLLPPISREKGHALRRNLARRKCDLATSAYAGFQIRISPLPGMDVSPQWRDQVPDDGLLGSEIP